MHWARQYKDVKIKIRAIDFSQLGICMRNDAAWSNAKEDRAQAGYLLAFANHNLREQSCSCPFHWRDLRTCQSQLRSTPIIGITDCKSVYDHVTTVSFLSGVQDKRVCDGLC